MLARELVVFNVLINRYHPDKREKLLSLVPVDQKKNIEEHKNDWNLLEPVLDQGIELLSLFHYSWISSVVKESSSFLQFMFGCILTEDQKKGLNVSSFVSLSLPVKQFLQGLLLKKLKLDYPAPLSFLPETEFFPLLDWKKEELVHLVDFMGLHDLASEIRQVLDKNSLKNVYASLSAREFHFLKVCLNQKERIVSPKLGVDLPTIDRKKLRDVLHQRGLVRLSQALFGQSIDFIWYLAHLFDKGRGTILLKNHQSLPIPKITMALKQQVMEVMNFLKSE